jgi:hypothetical protein
MKTTTLMMVLAFTLIASASAVPLQKPPCKGVGEFWQLPGVTGDFGCKEDDVCSPGCRETVFTLEGGGYTIRCGCRDGHANEDCCSLVLVLQPDKDPYLATIGDCSRGDPSSGCDFGDACVFWDVQEDGGIVMEAACI